MRRTNDSFYDYVNKISRYLKHLYLRKKKRRKVPQYIMF